MPEVTASAVLRSAGSEDADAVADVLIGSRRAFLPFAPSPHSDSEVWSWVRGSLVPGGRVVVCEREGRIVAVLSTSEERHGYTPIEFTDGQGNEEKCPDVLFELVELRAEVRPLESA